MPFSHVFCKTVENYNGFRMCVHCSLLSFLLGCNVELTEDSVPAEIMKKATLILVYSLQ